MPRLTARLLSSLLGTGPNGRQQGPAPPDSPNTGCDMAEQSGRDGPRMDRHVLDAELERAITLQQFVLFAQPQVAICGDTVMVTGHELLVRWDHPYRGLLLPPQFICRAEETGVVQHIDMWMLEQTCRLLSGWKNDPQRAHLRLSVNLSRVHFRDPAFAARVAALLHDLDAPAHRLTLEITETLPLDDLEVTQNTMRHLRHLGLALSLDDFGTGFSSLSLIQQLPFTEIKIDRIFVRELPENRRSAAIVKNMIRLAQALDLDVIAEGVETRSQMLWLVGNNCRAAQGFLFGRPELMTV
ncbi:EAL domain-containing protein (putative c-di-GMP-specific phosphodiesterase class I) [Roseinatronobacter thiooxidans]|uniref:EAL domain-containing protein (Putative c-di-GMP-specific phosphodiesterase class I) n=1 Tax=Roseinatronobacter thiooxidans TaxID=121821 RepID=A0A2W7PX50_9RHOB|nr:EAL domain-containing protein [Roseinatronobacter thiooxidans]PZX40681.1 EAL domain-containing protein (putative c-di-GMP-specific phosphodiesterase class I) [Roseinatronobacter thiooxidans]